MADASDPLAMFRTAPEAVLLTAPQAANRARREIRQGMRVGLILVMALLGLLVLLVIGLDVGAVAFATGLVLAVLPVPFYLSIGLWIDRYEPEPRWMVLRTFWWGATVAVFIALVLNTAGELIVGSAIGENAAEIYGGSISAPVVEESAKALALLYIYRRFRSEFDGIVDGVVYAVIVGLGFAMTENILYYSRGAFEEGITGAVGTFIVRGALSPFAHPLFTSMTGIGLGIAAATTRRWLRFVAPPLGLLGAMGLHSLWNTAAGAGSFVGVYFLIFVPVFLGMIGLLVIARRRESKIVLRNLQPEVERGLITPAELQVLGSGGARRRILRVAKRRHGRKGRRRVMEYFRSTSDLAFHRRRVERGLEAAGPEAAAVEVRCLQELATIREELRGWGDVLPA